MTDVQAPDGTIARFPEGMSDADIQKVMAREYPPTVPSGASGAVANFGRGARMAIPFADRAIAGTEALLGQGSYAENLARSQAADQALRASHSIAGNLGQGTGAVIAAAPAALIAPEAGAGLAARAAAGAIQGGTVGGLQGASQSPDLTNLGQALNNAGQGTNTGLAIGGAMPLAAGLAGKIPNIPQKPELGDQFTRDILNAGNVPGSNVSPSTLSAARNTITENMGKIAEQNAMLADPQLEKDIAGAIASQATPNPGVQKYANSILDKGPITSGKDYATMRSELTNKAYRARVSDPDSAEAYRGLLNAMDSAMDRSIASTNPQDVGVLRPLRQSYGALQDIAHAASKPARGTNQTALTPEAMQQTLAAGGGNNPQNYAMQSGPMDAITRAAMATPAPDSTQAKLIELLSKGVAAEAGRHVGHALLGGAGGYALGGIPGAAIGAGLAGGAVPVARSAIGNIPAVQEAAQQLNTPINPFMLSLARALAAKQAGQYNAP